MKQIITYDKLYHLDNNDNIRVWYMERNGSMYHTVSGTMDGKLVTSAWKRATAKNVGKANATTDESQAEAEIVAIYKKKLDRKYSTSPDTAQRSNFLAPMLAETMNDKKPINSKNKGIVWYKQPKLDGIRTTIDESGGTSRAGKPFFTVSHIVDILKEQSVKHNVVFDGELYNHDYREDFESLVSLIKKQKLNSLTIEQLQEIKDKVQFHVYDIIVLDEPEMGFEDRFKFLTSILEETDLGDTVKIVETVKLIDSSYDDIQKYHDEYFSLGYEGLMLRNADSIYEFKRSKGLWKFKNFDEGEFKLIRMIEGKGNWAGAVKAVEVEVPENNTTSEASVTGTYVKNVERLAQEKEYIDGDVTILHQGYTKDGKLRFGRVKTFHKGKRDY